MAFPWWLFAIYLARSGDVVSTEFILAAGFHETNPFMRERAVRITTAIAGPVLIELGARRLERDRHPRWAFALRVAAMAAWGYATAHNLRLLRARPP